VAAGSIAEEVGIEPGDAVLSVNGNTIKDILDYNFFAGDDLLSIEVEKKDGERWVLDIEKDPGRDPGLEFSATGLETITRCANKCIFCFVDQMPPGLRETLYIKDDDYRRSFLQGSFITLTNMPDRDFNRIARLRLSPLYVSVHTTNPGLRAEMLGNPRAGEILKQLSYLAGHGIKIHAQAVICPGINDGRELERTVADLAGLWPGVISLAVVPVGITGARHGLFPLGRFGQAEAAEIVGKVRGWQDGCLKSFNYPFVFASDEFYFLAGRQVPARRRYADFPQTENGVGLTRLFLDQWASARRKLPERIKKPLSVSLVTGMMGRRLLDPLADRLNRIENLQVRVAAVSNVFFGPAVTVAGLLTAKDILGRREELKQSNLVVLPASMLRRDSPLTLDDFSLTDLEEALGAKVKSAPGPAGLVSIIKDAAGD
jgi:putative radical SAM enzyme (TIGR03279 family)